MLLESGEDSRQGLVAGPMKVKVKGVKWAVRWGRGCELPSIWTRSRGRIRRRL